MPLTIAAMTAEIREVNIAKGWRSAAGGPGRNTHGDYIALLHSEVSEALEALRDWKLADATRRPHGVYDPVKPEGVGSEFADVLIRLLDTGDVFGFPVFDPDCELGDVADLDTEPMFTLTSFADHLAWIHFHISQMWCSPQIEAPIVLRALVTTARKFGIDLDFEYQRKVAYNRTRSFRHGGRALTDSNA